MRTVTVALPALGYIIATRAVLAAGIGLLLANRLSPPRRRVLGTALVAIGTAATVPIAIAVSHALKDASSASTVGSDRRLVGAIRFPRKGDDVL